MNLIAFGLILICCNVWAEETNLVNKYGKMLEDSLKKLKIILRTENNTLGIPVLDPFSANQLEFKLNEKIIKLIALMTNVNAIGLSRYDIINTDFAMSPIIVLNLHLSWPLIVATTDYSMKGNVGVFNIYGNGEIRMFAQNFSFDTTINFVLGDYMTLKVTDIKLKLSLKSLDFRITGVHDNNGLSALLSAIISDMAPQLIKNDKIVHKVVLLIRKQLNDFLYKKNVSEILKIIYYFSKILN